MPNEIRDKLIELIKQKSCYYSECNNMCDKCKAVPLDADDIEILADHLIENSVIVPPCKAGDVVYVTVYNIKTSTFNIHRGYISNISFTETGNRVTISHEGYDDEPLFNKFYGRFEDFGKVIFFTREEAEAKLRERN